MAAAEERCALEGIEREVVGSLVGDTVRAVVEGLVNAHLVNTAPRKHPLLVLADNLVDDALPAMLRELVAEGQRMLPRILASATRSRPSPACAGSLVLFPRSGARHGVVALPGEAPEPRLPVHAGACRARSRTRSAFRGGRGRPSRWRHGSGAIIRTAWLYVNPHSSPNPPAPPPSRESPRNWCAR
jgi:hypothetical protein